jgi:hypothetical protein
MIVFGVNSGGLNEICKAQSDVQKETYDENKKYFYKARHLKTLYVDDV